MDQDLVQALTAAARTNLTFLVTERGAPFTAAGFGNWFRDRCNEAGLPQCSAHGLRKLAATRMANAGCSTDQIKAVTGHKSLSEVARYTKAANQARLALELLLGTGQRRSDVVRMGWQHVRGDEIAVRQQKTDEPLLIPMDQNLAPRGPT